MWNPVLDVVGSWKRTSSGWGKVSVAAFYGICWMTLLINLVAIYNPLKLEYYACPVASLHPADPITTYIVLILRLWEWTLVVFFGLVLRNGWTFQSLGLLVIYWIPFYFLHLPAYAGLHGNAALDCIKSFWPPIGYPVLGVLVVTLAFKMMDERIKTLTSPTPGERTPLNVGV
jgi:hypothetical protein